jgi:hypothetical protein
MEDQMPTFYNLNGGGITLTGSTDGTSAAPSISEIVVKKTFDSPSVPLFKTDPDAASDDSFAIDWLAEDHKATDPSNGLKPTESLRPTESLVPVDPSDPSDDLLPTESLRPTESLSPVDRSDPSDGSLPMESLRPVDPSDPPLDLLVAEFTLAAETTRAGGEVVTESITIVYEHIEI